MKIKEGVKLAGIRPEIVLALTIADGIYTEAGEELVVTEVTGGKHSSGSLHYVGLAADIRTSFFSNTEAAEVTVKLRQKLGAQYDVVLEPDHIHLEFQPK